VALLLAGAKVRADSPAASFDQTSFPAAGTHDAILKIPQFGRYSITVSSAQGVALQLVDRMAGPGDVQGTPGGQDGRVDAFLERGTYKIHLIADAHGTGNARLSVTAFTELQPAPLQLIEFKPVAASLGDGQQLSWWVVIPSRGAYEFEAGGRYLTDLRLWRAGAWIIDAAPIAAGSDANAAQPLALRQLTARLEPGLYRLTAYGGAGLPWAKASGDKPFFLRWGIPSLSDSGRFVETASPLGLDRYLVPGTATDVRLVLDQPEAAQMFAQPFDGNTMFDQSQADSAGIDKTSRDPVADLSLHGNVGTPYLITVQRRPGAKYRLEIFNAGGGAASIDPGSGTAMLAVTLPGNPDDEIDSGFILMDNASQRVIASSVIDLDKSLPWQRRFNLLNQVQTFLYTGKDIDLRVGGIGVPAQYLVDRFITESPDGRVVPLAQPSGHVWTLTPGFYMLSAMPLSNGRGILTMSLMAAGTKPPAADSPRLPAPLFPNVALDPFSRETLYSSLGLDQSFGLREFALPAALSQPISFEIAAGREISFPIAVTEDGQLTVTDETGAAQKFSLDGQPITGATKLHAGTYQFQIAGPASGNRVVNVAETPLRLLPATMLPAIPPAQTAAPVLPPLAPGTPVYADLARHQSMTFALQVGQDALYQFQTTGLLETGGAIRTRVNPSLAQVEGNGVGRNFLLQPYLREGDYQLTVQAQGNTAGHAGISVAAAPVVDAGILAPNRPARLTLAPGEAACYRFHVATDGTYHIFTLGLGHQFAMRLEDSDGWPLIAPGGVADATMEFAPGDYRMILLPGPVENRAVTMLQPLLPPVTYQGHGPFNVVFGDDMQNRWLEPAAGQPRVQDRWNFSLPAAANATITIDNGIRAELHNAAGGPPLAVTGNGWTGKLQAGDYFIAASAAVPDNRVDYDLTVATAQLIPGQSLNVQAPASIPVSLGGSAQYEISSFGGQDVRASLYDAAGHLVAANDDRDNDWNFLISGAFPPGAYTLQVDPVGTDSAQTTVSIAAPASVEDAALAPNVARSLADGLVHVLPIETPPPDALLLASATAAVPVELALEANDGEGWQTLAQTGGIDPYLALPPATGARYRLRVWPEDHGATPISVITQAETGPVRFGLQGGLALSRASLGGRQIGWARIALPAAEILQLTDPAGTLRWSSQAGVALTHGALNIFATAGTTLWLASATPDTVTAQPADLLHQQIRLSLTQGQKLGLKLPAAPGIALWQAQAQGGQAGIAVDRGTGPRLMAIGAGDGLFTQAVAYQPPGLPNPTLHLWQAGPAISALPLTLQRIGFAAPAAFAAGPGETDGAIAAGAALAAGLPPGLKRLSLTLPAGIVAVLSSAGTPQTLILGNGGLPDITETSADQILLLNPGHGSAAFSLSVQPVSQPELTLAPGGLLTHYSPTAAILHITLSGLPAQLRLAGAATGLTAIDAAGQVTSGDAAQGGEGGTAIVTVQPGLAVISQDGAVVNALAQIVAAPGSIQLSRPTRFLNFSPADARLIHFETDTPIVLRSGDIPQPFPAGAIANLFQPKGKPLVLDVMAVSGGLSGTARFDAIHAIPITDGLGPKFLLAPGQSRLFTFSLTAPQNIGAGVRGSVDDANVRLLASDGTLLGQGLVLMHDLAPGTYYLAVDVPPDGVATTIQPALVGKTLPDDGPPDDVKAQYLALAGGN
jgi:hypothetical protein